MCRTRVRLARSCLIEVVQEGPEAGYLWVVVAVEAGQVGQEVGQFFAGLVRVACGEFEACYSFADAEGQGIVGAAV